MSGLTLDQLRRAHDILQRVGIVADPDAYMAVSRDFYVAYIRATERDPYRRAMLLYNAGCRGEALR